MSRLNDAISNVAYILDALMAYRNIVDSGDCNRCGKKKTCEYIPKVGQLVRYNCPFYKQNVADSYRQPTNEQRRTRTWTTEEVAELLFNMFGDDCACNFNNIDEWLPESCVYRETTCPDPKEKHGCWVQFLLQGGGSTSEEGHDKRRSNTVD